MAGASSRTLRQGNQAQIKRAGVLTALPKGSACVEIASADQGFCCHHLADRLHHGFGAFQAGSIGQGEVAPDFALVFIRDEGCGHGGQADGSDDQATEQEAEHQPTTAKPIG